MKQSSQTHWKSFVQQIGHLHDDIIWLQLPESLSLLDMQIRGIVL